MIPLFALLFSFYLIPDIATVVGYLVVSRPFLNLNNSAFIGKKHSFLMEVSQGKVNKNNNNNQFKKIALHIQRASQSASNIITPDHWALIPSLNHLSSLGGLQPVQQICY